MSLFFVKEDIISDDGILLLSKGQMVNEKVLSKLKNLSSTVSIDYKNRVIYNKKRFQNNYCIQKTTNKIIQSFGIRKHILDERILEKPNKVLSNIIFELKDEPWQIYINALCSYVGWLYAHSIDVSIISLLMAVELGYEDYRLHNIGLGALLHDIGMLMIPKTIIQKPEPLDKNEELIIFQHCELGVSSIELFNLPRECTEIIMQHHERLDGSGYPKGLKGNEISLSSKVVMIADIVDMMTSGMPNIKGGHTMDAAIRMLEKDEKVSSELVAILKKILGF